jgi:acetyltransferase-like isoleucine patch superfamily enzyme
VDYDHFYTKDLLGVTRYIKSIGEFSYGAPTVMEWGDGAQLVIGKFCSIAEKVTIFLGGNHNTHWVSTYPFSALGEAWQEAKELSGHPATKGDVVIGNDVWIGYGATILSGVHIGNGAIIGAHCVVASDVEPYTIVVGNPAKGIKKRFSDEEIEALCKINWWDWDSVKIRRFLPLLCDGDIKTFIGCATHEQ